MVCSGSVHIRVVCEELTESIDMRVANHAVVQTSMCGSRVPCSVVFALQTDLNNGFLFLVQGPENRRAR